MDKIIFEKVGQRLKQARELRHITLEEAGKKVDVHKSTVLRWENGETEKIKLPIIELLATYYNVNPVWLMGYDVPMERTTDDLLKKIGAIPVSSTNMFSIPILGTVKAGYNYLAQENIIDTISFEVDGTDKENYYALYVTGDSMDPLLSDGDIAIVHKQNYFKSGDNCIVLINGDEATIKMVKLLDNNEGIKLIPVNRAINPETQEPLYEDKFFTKKEIETIPVKIIGVVEKSIRNFNKKKK